MKIKNITQTHMKIPNAIETQKTIQTETHIKIQNENARDTYENPKCNSDTYENPKCNRDHDP